MSGSITINSNQASLSAQRRLGQSTSSLQQSFTRLASGLRINTSSDDAAGLAISESLNVDAAVFSQGVRNLNDSISLLNIAESALVELSNISIRLQELAAQSSNGTLGNQQRSALDEEADALIEEYNRITASVDFNDIKLLDGSLEVLTAQGGYGSSAGLQLSIGSELARMAGDGTFLAPITLDSVGNCPLDIELHDSNSDGILDLYVTTPQDEGYIAIFQGNGDGSFQARRTYESEGNLWDMAFGDFNGDGIDDVAVEEDTFNSLHIYLANSDGSLNAAVSFDGVSAEIPEVGDLNNDGKLDIVSGNQSGGLQVFLGNGDGSFSLGDTYAKTFDSLNSIELADFNGDGLLDFLSSGTYAAGNAPVEIRFGKGDGSFTAPVSYMYAGWGEEMEFADFNDDGKLDLVSVGRFEQNSFVFIGNGDGSFKHSVAYAESGEDEIYTVDVFDANGDGYMDL